MLKNKTEFDRKNTCFYVRLKTFQTILVNQSFMNDMEFQFLTVMDMFQSAFVLHFDNQIL